jgi:hypothetical protein
MNETSAETRRRGHRVISPVQIGLSQAHNDLALLNIADSTLNCNVSHDALAKRGRHDWEFLNNLLTCKRVC